MNRHSSKSKIKKQEPRIKSTQTSSNKTENKKKTRYYDDDEEDERLKMKLSRSESIRANDLNSISNKAKLGNRNVQSALPNFASQRRSTYSTHDENIKLFQLKRTETENNTKKLREKQKLRGLTFDDENLQAIYAKLCAQRDRIQKFDAERIELLKKADPVFAKRYKQFQNAKSVNKAPTFDLNDFNAPMNIFKIELPVKPASAQHKKPVEIAPSEHVHANEPSETVKSKYFQLKMQQMDLKVKEFIKSCEKGLCL